MTESAGTARSTRYIRVGAVLLALAAILTALVDLGTVAATLVAIGGLVGVCLLLAGLIGRARGRRES